MAALRPGRLGPKCLHDLLRLVSLIIPKLESLPSILILPATEGLMCGLTSYAGYVGQVAAEAMLGSDTVLVRVRPLPQELSNFAAFLNALAPARVTAAAAAAAAADTADTTGISNSLAFAHFPPLLFQISFQHLQLFTDIDHYIQLCYLLALVLLLESAI